MRHTEESDTTAGRLASGRASRLVVTDLDGTLLDADTYDWEPARPALEALAARGVPLVLSSSKTRREMEALRVRLGNRDPFVSENGGALFVPVGTASDVPGTAPLEARHGQVTLLRSEFGVPYDRLRSALGELAARVGVPLRGFGDMTLVEIGTRTGLAGEELAAAAEREYDEPFVAGRELTPEEEAFLASAAAAMGLSVTRGGRFRHLLGRHDKGKTLEALRRLYDPGGKGLTILALGDSANDLAMLAAADRAVIVARPDGTHAPELVRALPWARRTTSPGPTGFNEAVLEFLARTDVPQG
jgi:mannosyl-3-phosphoglycerate phosphatase